MGNYIVTNYSPLNINFSVGLDKKDMLRTENCPFYSNKGNWIND